MANRFRNTNKKFRNPNLQTGGIKKRLGLRNAVNVKKITDARQKIMQKKRKTVTDARDVLAKMAKKQDARSKILKIRESKTGGSGGNIRTIGSSILQKTDRNGKISLMTSRNKQVDMNVAIQQQLGLITAPRKKIVRKPNVTAPKTQARHYNQPLISKTILNDLDYHNSQLLLPSYEQYVRDFATNENPYNWMKPHSRITAADLINSPLARRPVHVMRNLDGPEWRAYSNPMRSVNMSTIYVDLDAPDDEEMPIAPRSTIVMQGSSKSNVHSRLDNRPMHLQSQGILSQTKTKVIVPAGHRIVVSNLQSTVTQDDIRELFEDIGELLVARLVRPGTAEVIYKNLKDAQKAVDTYHNRQLDGQPMKCLLVNKRPLNNPTGPAVTAARANSGILLPTKKTLVTSGTSEKLIPDLSTIHKVLFNRN